MKKNLTSTHENYLLKMAHLKYSKLLLQERIVLSSFSQRSEEDKRTEENVGVENKERICEFYCNLFD